ncbi:MAG: gas vesicle protein GvpG [Deltaproteobacteria bacterium]|nr:gas vesicle protein GvpG [Deltaproteobacteria bacterium]MBI5809771.1 gas vesicle protein GvpG [Deltaproteobacteria bacterium]
MGFLLDDILLFPVKGVLWVGEKVVESAKAEMTDESGVRESLLTLQMRLEAEEITEEEYGCEEAGLLEKLEEIRRLKTEENTD